MPFRLKTILGIALIEGIFLLVLVYTSIDYLQVSNRAEINKRAQSTASLFAAAAKDAVISSDISTLELLADELLMASEVKYIKIYDAERLLVSAGDLALLSQENIKDHDISGVDDGVLDVASDIQESGYYFGKVAMGFSTAQLDEFMAKASTRISSIALSEMFLVALFSWILGYYLTRNLDLLQRASKKILKGQSPEELTVKGTDEIAQTVKAFNEMGIKVNERTQALENANTRLNGILTAAVDGFVIIDTQGIIQQVNPAVSQLFGYDSEELLGENVAIFLPATERHRHDGYIQHYLATGEAKIIGQGREVMAQHKLGHLFPVDLSVSKMILDNQTMFLGLVKDLSDIKSKQDAVARSEAILLATLEASHDALITIDMTGRVLEFNESAVSLFGYSREQALGQLLEDLIIPPEHHKAHRAGMEHYRRTGEGPVLNKQIEVPAMTQAGDIVPVEMTVIPIQLDDEVLMTAFLRDISERKQTENKLKQAKEEAEQGSKAKSRFLATMSHEIRSPLNAVLGSVELMLESGLNQDQRLYANTAKEAGTALLSTINDILDFSKIEAGQMALVEGEFQPVAVVNQVLQILSPKAQDKGLHLASFINRNVPSYLVGDEQKLRQVLHNLVDNAIKFSTSGCIAVEMWMPDQAAEPPVLACRVKDQGIGIAPELQESLFKEFYQVHDENNTSYKGSGLGLAISAELISMMGGEIAVESKLGQGCCFSFHVVLEHSEHQEEPLRGIPSHSRVLLVFPDDVVAELINKQYSQYGVELTHIKHVADIYKFNQVKGRFNLILFDETCLTELNAAQVAILKRDFLFESGQLASMVSGISSDVSSIMVQIGLERVVNKPVSRGILLSLLTSKEEQSKQNESEPSMASANIEPSQIHILLAEDSPANQMVAGKMLTSEGYQVDYANNGLEAVEMAQAKEYQLILMDMRMPQMDGVEATKKILVRKPEQLVLAMSANVLKQDVELCLQAGMRDFIAKPVQRKELLSGVDYWLRKVLIECSQPAESVQNDTLPVSFEPCQEESTEIANDLGVKDSLSTDVAPVAQPPIERQAMTSEVNPQSKAVDEAIDDAIIDRVIVDDLLTTLGQQSVVNMLAVFIKEAQGRLQALTELSQGLNEVKKQKMSVALCLESEQELEREASLESEHIALSPLTCDSKTDKMTYDYDAIEGEAHTLKSSSGSFGAKALFESAKTLETLAREQNQTDIGAQLQATIKIGRDTITYYQQHFKG